MDPAGALGGAGRWAKGGRRGGRRAPPGLGARLPAAQHGARDLQRGVSGVHGATRVESPGVGAGRWAAAAPTTWLFAGQAAARAFRGRPRSPPAAPGRSPSLRARLRAPQSPAAEPLLPYCESRNELEASRAWLPLLVQRAGGLLLATGVAPWADGSVSPYLLSWGSVPGLAVKGGHVLFAFKRNPRQRCNLKKKKIYFAQCI